MSSDTTIFNPEQKWACLFPGIGVRLFGKEPLFYKKHETIIRPYLEMGSQLVGEDLTTPLLNKMNHHENQLSGEIFTYAFSCGTYKVLEEKGFQPSLLAGHSLGIYAALKTADCINYEDGLQIIAKAHQLGKTNCSDQEFGALIIIGLTHEEISSELIRKGYRSIQLANLNNPTSGVYVGILSETDQLTRWAEEAGAIKTLPLKTDIPYHNPLFMQKNATLFSDFLENFSWRDPRFPIVSALNHSVVTDGRQAREMTAANLSNPIHWPGLLQKLTAHNIDAAMECGLGVSLSQHSRFIESVPYHYNLRNMRRKLDY